MLDLLMDSCLGLVEFFFGFCWALCFPVFAWAAAAADVGSMGL
jgi:hypothetical protein